MFKKLKNRLRRWAIHKLGGFASPIAVITVDKAQLKKLTEEAAQQLKDELTKEVHEDA